MAQIKGKFISLTAGLMSVYGDALEQADQQLFEASARHWNELDPEGWYDVKHYCDFIDAYVKASPTREQAMITLGKNIYPTIKRTAGFPPGLDTPLDYIEFESMGYVQNLRGPEIQPRQFIKKKDGHVIVRTRMIEQDCRVLEGVYLGILGIAGVSNGGVKQEQCVKQGDNTCEFHITWQFTRSRL